MAVTSSKQWIHFLRSDRCPPTSNNLQGVTSNYEAMQLDNVIQGSNNWKPFYLLEVKILEGEVHLDDSGGLDAGTQNILFCRLVLLGAQSVQVVQETVGKQIRKSLGLLSFYGAHSSVYGFVFVWQ